MAALYAGSFAVVAKAAGNVLAPIIKTQMLHPKSERNSQILDEFAEGV